MKKILGLDQGGVILDFIPYRDTELAFKGERYLETPAVTDSIESVADVVASKVFDDVVIISRTHHPERGMAWLKHQDFFTRTGIPEDHFFSCAERNEKAPIAAKLGVTHFVDDRAEVLRTMIDVVPNLYLFQSLDENRGDFTDVLPKVHFYENWLDLKEALIGAK